MKRALILIVLFAFLFASCASQPDKIQTAYVSPVQYKSYNCQQLEQEMERVSRRAIELHHSLKKEADADAAQMAVGMIIFWPALFFLEGGDGPEAQEYARLKGEREALEKQAIEKKCDIHMPPIQPIQVAENKDSQGEFKLVCDKCGKALEPDAKFCPICGDAVSSADKQYINVQEANTEK